MTRVLIIMGVTGAGKTTLGTRLAEDLKWRFLDADLLHPGVNVAKMAQGIALEDEDRWPWLQIIRGQVELALDSGKGLVVVCSALKQSYRDKLAMPDEPVRFVFVDGSIEQIAARISPRTIAAESLLERHFLTLERPTGAITVSFAQTLEQKVAIVRKAFAEKK